MDLLRSVIIFAFGVFLGLNFSVLSQFYNCEEDASAVGKFLSYFGMKTLQCPTFEDVLLEVLRNSIISSVPVLLTLAMILIKKRFPRNHTETKKKGGPSPIWVSGTRYVTNELSVYKLDVTAIGKIKVSFLCGQKSGKLIVLFNDDD